MRIHVSNIIDSGTISKIVATIPEVYIGELRRHGSRSHDLAYDVQLRGSGARHTRRPNTGRGGAGSDERAATYEDWGKFIAGLYALDSTIKAGPYLNEAHFHSFTDGAFA